MRSDPIFENQGAWWFWDETWTESYGPFLTRHDAKFALERYIVAINQPKPVAGTCCTGTDECVTTKPTAPTLPLTRYTHMVDHFTSPWYIRLGYFLGACVFAYRPFALTSIHGELGALFHIKGWFRTSDEEFLVTYVRRIAISPYNTGHEYNAETNFADTD